MSVFKHKEMNAKVREYIERRIIPPMANVLNKALPATFKISQPGEAFFISDLIFADIQFKNETKPTSVVIKRWPEKRVEDFMFKAMFNNEIIFYTRYAKHCYNHIPKFYYFENLIEEECFIILENVNSLGYDLCSKSIDLEMDYMMASMKEIAKFHSAGYVMKTKHPEEFKEILGKIQESKYYRGNDFFKTYVNVMALRSVKYLRQIKYDPEFCDKMQTVLKDAFENCLLDSLKSTEPLATLCHGDFLRNNILYKRCGKEMEAMLIDFATIRYSNPAIDLSCFFYMSCSRSDILHKFDDIFGLYCDALHKCLSDRGMVNLEIFNSAALLEDYKCRAIHGFVIASFFLPIVIHGPPEKATEEEYSNPSEDYAMKSIDIGGEEMTKLLADMLLDLKNFGALDRFLK